MGLSRNNLYFKIDKNNIFNFIFFLIINIVLILNYKLLRFGFNILCFAQRNDVKIVLRTYQ